MSIRINKRGDTIVEVMIAAVVLSMMLVGAYTLSARASRLNQSAYERTKASQLVQEQAELLRYARDSGSSYWSNIIVPMSPPSNPFYDCRISGWLTSLGAGQFYLSISGATLNEPTLSPNSNKFTDNLYRTWVTKKTNAGSYTEYYIQTCWQGIGNVGTQMSATVVRLGAQ